MEVAVAKFTEMFILCLCMALAPAGTKETKLIMVGDGGWGQMFKLVKTDKGWDVFAEQEGSWKLRAKITAAPKNPAVFMLAVEDKGDQSKADLTEALKLIKLPLGSARQEVKVKEGKIVLAARGGAIFATFDGMTAIVLGIVPPREGATTKPANGPLTLLDKVALRDVQALHGGTNVFILGNGACGIQIVKSGEGGLQEKRYNIKLADKQMIQLADLLEKRFFMIRIPDRPGLPDEANVEITARLIGGSDLSQAKWANEKNADFDAIYDWLLDIARNVKGEPSYAGKYDYKWRPEQGK